MNSRPYSHYADDRLLQALRSAVADERTRTSEVVALIAEVDRRRLYAAEGYESMHDYCIRELRLSRESAFKRIRVARLARRWPAIIAALADGRLNLSGLVMLSRTLKEHPYLGRELLNAIAGKTTAEIAEYLAARFPRPDFEPRIVAVGSPATGTNGVSAELSSKTVEAANGLEMGLPELSARTVQHATSELSARTVES